MSVVIIGGHERMVCEYRDICKSYNCKSKVFAQMPSDLKNKIGRPDLMVVFVGTASHKMVNSAVKAAQKVNAKIVRAHTSSSCALKGILDNMCVGK